MLRELKNRPEFERGNCLIQKIVDPESDTDRTYAVQLGLP